MPDFITILTCEPFVNGINGGRCIGMGNPMGMVFQSHFYTAMTWEYLVGLLHYLFLRSSTILSMSIVIEKQVACFL